MAHLAPEEFSGSPAARLAEHLLAAAREQPGLVRRVSSAAMMRATRAATFPSLALLADPALDVRQYLEELVSVAVSSAQQAESVSLQARQAGRKAQRGMMAVACFGAVGLIVGIAGLAASCSSSLQLLEMRGEVSALQDMQRQAQDQLADLGPRSPEPEVAQPARVTPAAVLPPAPAPIVPVVQSRPVRASQPWPDSRPAVRRMPVTHTRRQVVVPQFFADLQRSIRAIFH